MAAQPDGGTPVETGADGGDQEVDLRELRAEVKRNGEQIKKLITIVAHNTGRTAAQLEEMLD